MGLRSRLRTGWSCERLAIWILGICLVGFALLVGFAGTPYTASEGTVERVAAESDVHVETAFGGYAIRPTDTKPDTALIFYPGARVDPNAYVAVLAPVVERSDIAVFIPRPRLNLAVFELGLAGKAIASNPSIEHWYVGGHSLGGAMACRYAEGNRETVTGVVLFGSYCDISIADTDLAVLSIGGTKDGVLGTERSALRPENLPPDATIRQIAGANHTQFGSYTGQPGDTAATISRQRAHELIQSVLVEFFEESAVTARARFSTINRGAPSPRPADPAVAI